MCLDPVCVVVFVHLRSQEGTQRSAVVVIVMVGALQVLQVVAVMWLWCWIGRLQHMFSGNVESGKNVLNT